MSGGWGHVTNGDGTPYKGEYGMADLLENGGDVNEAVEEMYGMVWWLAARLSQVSTRSFPLVPPRNEILAYIRQAELNHTTGIRLGTGEDDL